MNQIVLTSMAKAFFASAWADYQDENGLISFCGVEIMDVLPVNIDPAAIDAAKELYTSIEKANGKSIDDVLSEISIDAETFGHYSAMDAMGHGVGLQDYGIDSVVVPMLEFSIYNLELEY